MFTYDNGTMQYSIYFENDKLVVKALCYDTVTEYKYSISNDMVINKPLICTLDALYDILQDGFLNKNEIELHTDFNPIDHIIHVSVSIVFRKMSNTVKFILIKQDNDIINEIICINNKLKTYDDIRDELVKSLSKQEIYVNNKMKKFHEDISDIKQLLIQLQDDINSIKNTTNDDDTLLLSQLNNVIPDFNQYGENIIYNCNDGLKFGILTPLQLSIKIRKCNCKLILVKHTSSSCSHKFCGNYTYYIDKCQSISFTIIHDYIKKLTSSGQVTGVNKILYDNVIMTNYDSIQNLQ